MEMHFCLGAVENYLSNHGKPKILNTDHGSQFTSQAFTNLLMENATISGFTTAVGPTQVLTRSRRFGFTSRCHGYPWRLT